jgi:predicted transcriptional regulator
MSNIEITKDVTIVVGEERQDGVMRVRTQSDAGFSKIWIDMMMLALGITGSSKARVIGHLLKNRDSNNRVHGSFDEIAEAAETGRATVARTMKALQKSDLVERERDGVYLVNPNWIWEGGHKHRLAVLIEFQELRHPERKKYVLEDIPEDTEKSESAAAE